MQPYSTLKPLDFIFVYSQPPEHAYVGVIESIEPKIIYLKIIKREGDKKQKNGEVVEIDLGEKPSITLLNHEKCSNMLSPSEYKKLRDIRSQVVSRKEEKILW